MNPNTGHMVKFDPADLRPLQQGYEALPKRLQAEAEKTLAGRDEAHIDLSKRGPLQAWAKKKRQAKMAAKSRRINRAKK